MDKYIGTMCSVCTCFLTE